MKIVAIHNIKNKTEKCIFDEVRIYLESCFYESLDFIYDGAKLDLKTGKITQEFLLKDKNKISDVTMCIDYLRDLYPLVEFSYQNE